ncbi:MAG: nucleotide sugar dehydrogenase [Pseudomonadota bacterium]
MTDRKIAVIGLGYVGLPLVCELSRKFPVIGFDVSGRRISELRDGRDSTREVDLDAYDLANVRFTDDQADLKDADFYIVTVPTPIDDAKNPDMSYVEAATATVAAALKAGDIVVYESTVYPGATEEVCVPILERHSGLALNDDFAIGYSPERINPGDPAHRLTTIVKVISASTPEALDVLEEVYGAVVDAGLHRAHSIMEAEAAKVLENTQRDVNIALINEVAMLCSRLNIDTTRVLEAASTKWNFLNFRPGLVGGHCVSVDPYYLCHKAKLVDVFPELILAGRRVNDGMAAHIARRVLRALFAGNGHSGPKRILLMGIAFKENCPDIRNSKAADIVSELQSFGVDVDIWDPWVSPDEVEQEYGYTILPPDIDSPAESTYDAVVLAVAHDAFKSIGNNQLLALFRDPNDRVLFDVKSALDPAIVTDRL